MGRNTKTQKDAVPEGFTWQLATVDAVPVILFAVNTIIIGRLISSSLFVTGAVISFFAGFAKVIWKYIVALKQKNIRFFFIQMRILMPIGFLLMIIGICVQKAVNLSDVISAVISMPSAVFFGLGFVGMIMMMIFAIKLDNSKPKSNWIEQLTNATAQGLIAVGLFFLV